MPSWLHIQGPKQHNALPYKVTTLQIVFKLQSYAKIKITINKLAHKIAEWESNVSIARLISF